ncbi:MAG: fchA [Chloroflexi bacterium]|jgi:formiminotetrahydrofolate cyclodeaminase|nr:fchA [Chloroflexota bacterium]
MLADLTIEEFMSRLGSGDATPGGGGAAALAGAAAAGLVTMVARLTTGRPAFARIEERVQDIIREGDRLREYLLASVDTDAAAFDAVMAAYALPRGTEQEKAERKQALQPALRGATESPLAIARACLIISGMAAEMAEAGNPQTITDAGTAATLAQSAMQGAIFQARVNLKSIKDETYTGPIRQEIKRLEDEVQNATRRTLQAVEEKLG